MKKYVQILEWMNEWLYLTYKSFKFYYSFRLSEAISARVKNLLQTWNMAHIDDKSCYQQAKEQGSQQVISNEC